MKLMIYNIYEGAAETLAQIEEIVAAEQPDYLMFNEANTFADASILEGFARRTDFPYFDVALSGQGNYHVAVFSKYPLKEVKKLQPLARAGLIATIDCPLGQLSIASLHLTPFSEDLRHPEIDLILSMQKKYQKRILMGDMNSLSRADEYDNSIVNDFNQMQTKKFTTGGKLRFDAIDKILSEGYIDTAQLKGKNKEFTVPTPANKDATHAPTRLDYIFISEPLVAHLREYEVVKNNLTEQASDHYPVTVTLN